MDRSVRCPECGTEWPVTTIRCPADGSLLEDVLEEGFDDGLPTMHEKEPLGTRHQRRGTTKPPATMIPAIAKSGTVGERAPDRREIAVAPQMSTVLDRLAKYDLPRGTLVGEFQIETKLGEGGVGTVYGATQPRIGRQVAIKVMHPALCGDWRAVERFVQEARTVCTIRHSAIVDVFSFGELLDGRAYLVMEWLKGESLRGRLVRGRIGVNDALDIIVQITHGLEAAHEKGVIHRDLKPENVFLEQRESERPTAKLLDFGLAKLTDGEVGQISRTQTGTIVGTPLYISPEQATGKGVDHRTDIYALGCMAYELIVGRVPFNSDNVAELLSSHLVVPPPLPSSLWPEIRPELDKLLHTMIAKNPAERPTLAQIRDTIQTLSAEPVAPTQPAVVALPVAANHDVRPANVSPKRDVQPAAPLPIETPPIERPRASASRELARVAILCGAFAAIVYVILRLAH